jgi:hypothetical protein
MSVRATVTSFLKHILGGAAVSLGVAAARLVFYSPTRPEGEAKAAVWTLIVLGAFAGAILWLLQGFRQKSPMYDFVAFSSSFGLGAALLAVPEVLAPLPAGQRLEVLATAAALGFVLGAGIWYGQRDRSS